MTKSAEWVVSGWRPQRPTAAAWAAPRAPAAGRGPPPFPLPPRDPLPPRPPRPTRLRVLIGFGHTHKGVGFLFSMCSGDTERERNKHGKEISTPLFFSHTCLYLKRERRHCPRAEGGPWF